MFLKTNKLYKTLFFISVTSLLWISCATKPSQFPEQDDDITVAIEENNENLNKDNLPVTEEPVEIKQPDLEIIPEQAELSEEKKSINLLFAGDIMAHTENYQISSFSKIWTEVKDDISNADLAFANIESPVDTTKPESTYPAFNMPKAYVQSAIDAGFDAFSLCNNHTNDQGLNGILETMKTTEKLTSEARENNHEIYFSGLKQKDTSYTYNIIEKDGWKILFLPITELLNSPSHSEYVNFVNPGKESRKRFIEYCKKLREENICDIFILSVHTSEPEYTRAITDAQNDFYMNLLDAGVDILWANHAHIIKDRKFVFNAENQSQKLIMYANGNTISGQRRNPALSSQNPNGERDNTGDGLLYSLTLEKENDRIKIANARPIFITTYINTANEFVIKKLNEDFVTYLEEVGRKDWAQYIKRRIKITNSETRDLILWQ